jgi:hypothetical protein
VVDRARLEELRSTLYKVTPLRAEDLEPGVLEHNGWFVDVFAADENARSPGDNPILAIADQIRWGDQAVTIGLTGGTGVGKTTQLGRLATVLWETQRIACVTIDYGEFSELSSPPDITDFLLTVVGGFARQAARRDLLPSDWDKQTIGNRLLEILRRLKIELEVGLPGAAAITVQDRLSQDEAFRGRLRAHLATRVTEVIGEVRDYAGEIVSAIRANVAGCSAVALVVDSTEKFAAPGSAQEAMHTAVRNLFVQNSHNLEFPELHTIYLVPPWLPVSDGGAIRMGFHQFPAIRIERREDREVDTDGLALIGSIVRARMPEVDALIEPDDLDRLCRMSGGVQRVLFQMLHVLAGRARASPTLPVPGEFVESAIETIREDYLAVTREAAPWLDQIQQTASLDGLPEAALTSLGAYFQAMVVLQFANGTKWYAIHPLMRDRVKRAISANG